MIRTTLALLLLAAPATAQSLVGDWHCLQEGPEARVEAEARFTADGIFTAQMEYRFVRGSQKVRVTAVYAATWRMDGALFWDDPQDARITGTFVDGTPTPMPNLEQGIRASLLERPDAPMQVTFPDPGFALLRGTGEDTGGAPFQCVRLGSETNL